MSRRSLHFFSWATAFGLALLASFAANGASAYCRMTTGGGQQVGEQACVEIGAPLVWNDPCLSYAVDGSGSEWMELSDIEDSVNAAFETWETAACPGGSTPNLVFKPSMQPSTCKRPEFNTVGTGGNVNTIAFLDPWGNPCADRNDLDYRYEPRAFAVTIVWYNTTTGQILDADMMINDLRFVPGGRAGGPYADCPETGCLDNDADLRGIVTHEAGHFIGIGHCNPIDKDDPDDPCVVATMYWPTEMPSTNGVSRRTTSMRFATSTLPETWKTPAPRFRSAASSSTAKQQNPRTPSPAMPPGRLPVAAAAAAVRPKPPRTPFGRPSLP